MFNEYLKRYHLVFSYLYIGVLLLGGMILNIKFVQLGIPHYIELVLGGEQMIVGFYMIILAVSGFSGSFIMGVYLNKKKIHLIAYRIMILVIILFTFFLMIIMPIVVSRIGFMFFIIFLGISLGMTSCIVMTLFFKLIPQNRRVFFAGFIAGFIYLFGNLTNDTFSWESFRTQNLMLAPFIVAVLVFFILFDGFDAEFIKKNENLGKKYDYNFKIIVVILFLVLFIDSFGFLRVLEDPVLLSLTWQSDIQFRQYIAFIHIVVALIFTLLFDRLGFYKTLIVSLFLFVIADITIAVFYLDEVSRYFFVAVYASAVSIYSIVFLSMVTNISNKENIEIRAGIYMGLIAWFSSYLATGMSLILSGMSFLFAFHMIITAVLALSLIFVLLYLVFFNDY